MRCQYTPARNLSRRSILSSPCLRSTAGVFWPRHPGRFQPGPSHFGREDRRPVVSSNLSRVRSLCPGLTSVCLSSVRRCRFIDFNSPRKDRRNIPDESTTDIRQSSKNAFAFDTGFVRNSLTALFEQEPGDDCVPFVSGQERGNPWGRDERHTGSESIDASLSSFDTASRSDRAGR